MSESGEHRFGFSEASDVEAVFFGPVGAGGEVRRLHVATLSTTSHLTPFA